VAQAATAARPRRAPAKPRPQPKPPTRAKPKAKQSPRARVAGGAVWIGVVAVLLSGVVAINVAVLRLNVQLEDLGNERTQLRAENADLSSQIASKAQAGRIQTLARGQLGLEPAGAGQWTYLDLGRAATR
jgi:cell division protein FtsL